ncbi:hypothetical protein UA08_07498 [Talaromyces atroroseus]|uniref:Major facilitator superfamily (MFS) profile domain-containing protein n=1 Tax=Talaromyces atroroseus TaxID=1441469 RepID=A0A225AJH5_TALAT|nr:hypothetical protein UA08_07498 [Talaromyces atroroseus]OKL57308.1 hypothetical protein UA08_07498 [Talaromyces atroroseus]
MATDLEKAETNQEVLHDINQPGLYPEGSKTLDTQLNKDVESSAGYIEPTLAQPASPQYARLNPALVPSETIIAIPRSKRRGLLGSFAIIPEIERPYNYASSTKWVITLVVALASAAAPLGSAIFFPALSQISQDFHATPTLTNLTVALYLLSMSIFPLWWSSFSETLGRRTIYLVSFALFTLWNIIAAVSTSMAMLIVMRVLGGGASSSVLAIGAGTVADVWEPRQRGNAMGIFILGPMLGPLLAPIIGGVVAETWGWRSTQWFQTIYGGVLLIVLIFCLPETLARRGAVEQQAAVDSKPTILQRTKKGAAFLKRSIIDPLGILSYLRFPVVFITVWISSVTFGSLYMLNIAIQRTFSNPPYSFSEIIVGLTYIPGSLGYMVAGITGGKWADAIMHREARTAGRYDASGKLILKPEDRMRENALLAAVIYPAALLWFGWTADQGVFWIAPLIANFFFGFGTMIIYGTANTMLTEFLPKRSSSGVAVSTFVRNIFSCVGAVVAQPILEGIGDGWLFTILGIIGWISAFSVVYAMNTFGPRWQNEMKQKLAR